ncbi:hypothetical protein AGR7C_Cc140007 [Agrobacterium deltaense Zutra 3/1]|uniref:Uncharacterized protein n=1 Tax=Agrobacterium deltaense Zutra 3/1 TaxID=1183427 RepID=A0A1S7PBI5_9HYPH|nr:hypothetical protein AGR7C_Cc140007 [Agrobacterium deltaense Zutra 3/1]
MKSNMLMSNLMVPIIRTIETALGKGCRWRACFQLLELLKSRGMLFVGATVRTANTRAACEGIGTGDGFDVCVLQLEWIFRSFNGRSGCERIGVLWRGAFRVQILRYGVLTVQHLLNRPRGSFEPECYDLFPRVVCTQTKFLAELLSEVSVFRVDVEMIHGVHVYGRSRCIPRSVVVELNSNRILFTGLKGFPLGVAQRKIKLANVVEEIEP